MLLSIVLSSAIAYSYVGSIKIGQPQSLDGLPRNDVAVVKYRLRRVSFLCLAILISLPVLVTYGLDYYDDIPRAIRQLGLIPGYTNTYSITQDMANILLCFAKMSILYCGPLASYFITSPAVGDDLVENFASLWGFRDHVFAPVTEELVYRASIICLLQPVVNSSWALTVYTPLLFGIAHLHHGYELFKQGTAISTVVATASFQLLYTTLFGILANRIYISSGENLWCAIVMHSACNLGGFPSFEVKETHPRFFYVYCIMLVFGLTAFLRLI
ncbi:hypothetical protein FT663_04693 [Candidozyma haemuli var. vulneris]|uniref:intramembrane prenyl-peptidase Rce1 n=1 Tax=Candidozyma haemuli TaxID=45357 RepID=A0A2V1AQ47_9ASCO|nr:hypothetical protein CXQ85_001755 [[Candida] haemuloni]KAF3985894.1 hypothetical protein FT662_04883 [[Candida] haemuloni var. vulneris]KAF3986881.1 hypothetical protein FT663_04693 [[Candida] haemuloni var. vulneris]PVH19978.1 hypothetical protein CXQ85_001755 [[Candida] haemuloni]